ncbi:tetratricopeptide repeat protein [Hydrocarboniphaga effusa]|uniref:tetratricopeptide repeat protein n=1 Tax=Hydrocarboniphaga effusa TaxID=243629 RepID=UPI00398BBF77
MPFFILSLIIQVGLVVHVLKTGRNMSWIFILLFFPLVGTLAYLIVELLPEWTSSRGAHRLKRGISKSVNPDGDLRRATQQLAVADTVQNAMTLAAQYMEKQRYEEAEALYARYLKGINASDPLLLLGIAKAQFALGKFEAAEQSLDTFKQKNPDFRSPEGHLLYARTQEELGRIDAAIHEYDALRRNFPGPEPTCRLALLLQKRGDQARARELFQRIVDESRVAGKHYNTVHREWVALAKREASGS